jgi:hypothetical protein
MVKAKEVTDKERIPLEIMQQIEVPVKTLCFRSAKVQFLGQTKADRSMGW